MCDVGSGKGRDRLGTAKDGLRLKWGWYSPGQCCVASLDAGAYAWSLEVAGWVDGYTDRVGFMGTDYGVSISSRDDKQHATRAKAQLVAEEVLRKIVADSVDELRRLKPATKQRR